MSALPEETLDDPDALADYLIQHKIHKQAVDILKAQLVDGSTLITLTAEQLKDMEIKAGPVQKIFTLISSSCQVVNCQVTAHGSLLLEDRTTIEPASKVNDRPALIEKLDNNATVKAQNNPPSTSSSYYNIRDWVLHRDHDDGEEVDVDSDELIKILDSGIVPDIKRQLLVRVVVSRLVKIVGNLYPSGDIKELAAKSIVASFPKLKTQKGQGHESYYDKKTACGFIEYRLKTMRKSQPDGRKRRASNKNSKNDNCMSKNTALQDRPLMADEEYNSKVSELQFKMPTDINKPRIVQLMDETRRNRQEWILSAGKNDCEYVSLRTMLETFPKFMDYHGELILREFQDAYTDEDAILAKFPSYYVQRILKLCKMTKPDILKQVSDIKDENLKALMVLPNLLPVPNYTKKCSDPKKLKGKAKKSTSTSTSTTTSTTKVPNPSLIRFIDAQDSLFQSSGPKHCVPIQPYLICATSNNQKKGLFFIMADGYLIRIGESIMVAFDILVKLHFCFDICFAPDLEYFYNFICTCVMDLKSVSAKNCCMALDSTFHSMTSDTDASDEENMEGESE